MENRNEDLEICSQSEHTRNKMMAVKICRKSFSQFLLGILFPKNLLNESTLFSVFIKIKLIHNLENDSKAIIWLKEAMLSIICLQFKKN